MVLSICFWALSGHKVANAFSNTNFTINKVCLGLIRSHINQGSTGGDADNPTHRSDSGPIEMFILYFLCPRYDDIMTDTVKKLFVDHVDSLLRRGGGSTLVLYWVCVHAARPVTDKRPDIPLHNLLQLHCKLLQCLASIATLHLSS